MTLSYKNMANQTKEVFKFSLSKTSAKASEGVLKLMGSKIIQELQRSEEEKNVKEAVHVSKKYNISY